MNEKALMRVYCRKDCRAACLNIGALLENSATATRGGALLSSFRGLLSQVLCRRATGRPMHSGIRLSVSYA
jgi:hypothetical protein